MTNRGVSLALAAFIFLITNVSAQQNIGVGNSTVLLGAAKYLNPSIEETKGSRYLLTAWGGGIATGRNGEKLDAGYLFNYDKIDKQLLLTKDRVNAVEINMGLLNSFRLSGDGQDRYFERVPGGTPNQFAELIAGQTGKPALYKEVKTKFEKSNYHSDGLVESGNKYDEYTDSYVYYFCAPGVAPKKVELKKRSVNDAFASFAEKLAAYNSAHPGSDINEAYLTGLVNSLQ